MYVGKTDKSFKQEMFGAHKLNVYPSLVSCVGISSTVLLGLVKTEASGNS